MKPLKTVKSFAAHLFIVKYFVSYSHIIDCSQISVNSAVLQIYKIFSWQ